MGPRSFRLSLSKGENRFFDSLRKHCLLYIVQAIVFLIVMPAFVSIINFSEAVTPEQAVSKYGQSLPFGWSVGVMNHGDYFQWWTISERPIMFGFSMFFLVAGLLFLVGSIVWLHFKDRPCKAK